MYPTGHRGISLLLYTPILAALLWLDAPLLGLSGVLVMLVTASWPDKDLNYWFLKHRGPTHSVWFAALIGIPFAIIYSFIPPAIAEVPYVMQIAFGWFVGFYGIMGHVAGDAITPSGVQPLYPWGKKYRFHLTTAQGVWWFEDIRSGSQQRMTAYEQIRHAILNSNRVFFLLGAFACAATMALFIQ